MFLESESENHSVVSSSLRPHGLYSPWNSPGKNAGVGSVFLLQGIFPTQGWNPGLPHCRRILYQLSHSVSYVTTNVMYGSCLDQTGNRSHFIMNQILDDIQAL